MERCTKNKEETKDLTKGSKRKEEEGEEKGEAEKEEEEKRVKKRKGFYVHIEKSRNYLKGVKKGEMAEKRSGSGAKRNNTHASSN